MGKGTSLKLFISKSLSLRSVSPAFPAPPSMNILRFNKNKNNRIRFLLISKLQCYCSHGEADVVSGLLGAYEVLDRFHLCGQREKAAEVLCVVQT